MNTDNHDILEILKHYKKFTVYGLSSNSEKPAQTVPVFMRSKGYEIAGVNPQGEEIAGFPIYTNLASVPPEFRTMVDVFQRPERIPEIVEEVLKLGGVEVLWLQKGITHPEAEARAEAAGIKVVSDRCLYIEYERCASDLK